MKVSIATAKVSGIYTLKNEWELSVLLHDNFREEMWETFEENTNRHFKDSDIWTLSRTPYEILMSSTKEEIDEAFEYWMMEFYIDVLWYSLNEEGWFNSNITIGLEEEEDEEEEEEDPKITKDVKTRFDAWLNYNNDVVAIDGEHYEPAVALFRIDGAKYLALLQWFSEYEHEATYDTYGKDGKKIIGPSSVEMYRRE